MSTVESKTSLGTQEEMYQLVRDGFYVSAGSTPAHVLFIHYLSAQRGITVEDAAKLYLISYQSLDLESKRRLIKSRKDVHNEFSEIAVEGTIKLRKRTDYRLLSEEGWEFEQFSSEMTNLFFALDVFYVNYLENSTIENKENLAKILKHLASHCSRDKAFSSLRVVGVYLKLFEDKHWYNKLTNEQKETLRSRGEAICREALDLQQN